jgi:hypothetical protein
VDAPGSTTCSDTDSPSTCTRHGPPADASAVPENVPSTITWRLQNRLVTRRETPEFRCGSTPAEYCTNRAPEPSTVQPAILQRKRRRRVLLKPDSAGPRRPSSELACSYRRLGQVQSDSSIAIENGPFSFRSTFVSHVSIDAKVHCNLGHRFAKELFSLQIEGIGTDVGTLV